MSNRLGRAFGAISEMLYAIGSGLLGVVPAVRSKDGSFGTQRMRGVERARQRDETYPHD